MVIWIAACIFVGVVSLFLFIFGLMPKNQAAVANRVKELTESVAQQKDSESRRKFSFRGFSRTGRQSARQNVAWASRLETLLRRGEIDLSVQDFLLRWFLGVVVLSILGFLLVNLVGVLLVVAISMIATFAYLKGRESRRLKRFDEGLGQMVNILANSLRAGHSFLQAMNIVVTDMQGPIREEFQRIIHETQMGVSLEEALERANQRIGSEDFDMVVTGVLIQRQIGGNLATVLSGISNTIVERTRLSRELKALTAQGRMSALIFVLLPFGVGAAIYLIDRSYISILFTSTIGRMIVLLALISQGIGWWVIRRIVRIEL